MCHDALKCPHVFYLWLSKEITSHSLEKEHQTWQELNIPR